MTSSHGGARAPREPGPGASDTPPAVLLALAAILVLAAGLRLFRLDSGLWYDEIVTLVDYVRLPMRELLTTYTTTNNHVLYSLAARVSIVLGGETPFFLRLPAALFGVAGVGAVYLLGREVTDRNESLWAALFTAVSYHAVWFSQNARGYTGLVFFTVLGTALFLRGLRRPTPAVWIGYGGCVGLGLFTHLSAGFVFASHAIVWASVWLWARRPSSARGAAPAGAASVWPPVGFALGGLLTLLLHAPLLPQIVAALATQSAGGPAGAERVDAWTSPVWLVLETVRGMRIGVGPGLALAGAAGVAAVGFASHARRSPVVAALMVLPPIVCLAAVLALHFHVWPRYFLTSIGFAMLVAARGASVVAGWIASLGAPAGRDARARRLTAALCAAGALLSAATLAVNYRLPKQDYAGAREWVESRRAGGDEVVSLGLARLAYSRLYAPEWAQAADVAELEALRPEGADLWVVYSFPTHMAAVHGELLAALEAGYAVEHVFPGTLGDGEVIVRRSRGAD